MSFTDERGTIENLRLAPMNSFSRITSKKGSIRANHWHRTDWHDAYVVSGRVAYFERERDTATIPEPTFYGPGEMFNTPPGVEHAMLFTEDSVILTVSGNPRDHESHEADVVRVSFVTPDVAAKYL
jgi:quercetin dioxygenase-like cupin family protein